MGFALILKNHLILAIRNLRRYKYLTGISLVSLSVAIITSLFVVQYMSNELSYDTFHDDPSSIYRVRSEIHRDGNVVKTSSFLSGLPPILLDKQPAIEDFTRVLRGKNFFEYKEKSFEVPYIYADASFFDFFNFPIINGDELDLNQGKDIVLLDSELSLRLFGNEPAIGKPVRIEGKEFIVAGIFDKLPVNTHIKAEAILPFLTLPNSYHTFPNQQSADCYLRIADPLKLDVVLQTIHEVLDDSNYGIFNEEERYGSIFSLQPLSDVRLHSSDLVGTRQFETGNYELFVLLGVFATLVVAMSWFNYINLSLANALKRGKEVGIKRIMGATKWQIALQFVTEATLLLVIALACSITVYQSLYQELGMLFNSEMRSLFEDFSLMTYWPFLTFVVLIATSNILSGFYVGSIVNAFKPITAIKGGLSGTTKGFSFKKGLLIMQFVVAAFAIILSVLIQNQVNFAINKDLGVDIDNVLVFDYNRHNPTRIPPQLFASKISGYPFVEKISMSDGGPGIAGGRRGLSNTLDENGKRVFHNPVTYLYVDQYYLDLYNIELLAGRNFNGGKADEQTVIVNRKYAEDLGYRRPDDAIGQKIGSKRSIIGVIENYHTSSLRKEMMNVSLSYRLPRSYTKFAVKIKSGHINQAIEYLSEDWKEVFDSSHVPIIVLKDRIQGEYASDQYLLLIIKLLTMVTLIISVSGLIGITHLSVIHRLKEIGLRKLLGARWLNTALIFSRSYLSLILLSLIIAVPLSVELFQRWIEDFAYRIDLTAQMFLIPLVLIIVLSLAILLFQASRSFKVRPIDSIKHE